MSCIKCGREIDQHAIDTKKAIAARLYPGRDVPPPKVCSRCLWTALEVIEAEDLPPWQRPA